MENQPVYDQDSSGICASTSSALGVDAFLRRQTLDNGVTEEVSPWSLAINGAQALAEADPASGRDRGVHSELSENRFGPMPLADAQATASQFVPLKAYPEARPSILPVGENFEIVNLTIPQSRDYDFVSGSNTCAIVEQMKKRGSWCPASDSPIEQSLKSSRVDAQGKLLMALGRIFDSTYSDSANLAPQKTWEDLSMIAKSLWDQAESYCQVPIEQRMDEQAVGDYSDPLGALYLNFRSVYSASSDAFLEAKKPYDELFQQRIALDQVKKTLVDGPYIGGSWEQEISFLQESLQKGRDRSS